MHASVKAIVFRTTRLKETNAFFEKIPGLLIAETSPRHFVINNKGIRLVFMESGGGFEIEIYVSPGTVQKVLKDPNGISVITTLPQADQPQKARRMKEMGK